MALIDDVAQHIHNQGIASLASTLFKAQFPTTPDSAMCVLDTGGTEPDKQLPFKQPTFQVMIRSTTYSGGKASLELIRTALHQKTNQALVNGGTYFFFIFAISEGGHLGRDEVGRELFSINFRCKTR